MLSAFHRWIDSEALETWRTRGFDPARDLFHERLGMDGLPLAVPYRAMVQARQIYVFSHAALLQASGDGAEKADRAMRRLRRDFAITSAGETSFHFSIDASSGAACSTVRDSYTHAFVLFATAFLYRVTGDPSLVGLADEVSRFVDRRLADPLNGGVVDALPGPDGAAKRQNPQMHLLEAYIALEEAMPGRGYLDRALALVQLFKTRLFDPQSEVLREHFAADWSAPADAARTDVFEPGHHYEWVWLLERMETLSGGNLAAERKALWRTAQADGHAPGGLIYDELGIDRRIVSPAHRLWPLTEAIKAAGTAHRGGDPTARDFAERMAALLLKHYLRKPFDGGWADHLEPDLSPRVSYVPASSLYHLFLASAEARKTFADAGSSAPGPEASIQA